VERIRSAERTSAGAAASVVAGTGATTGAETGTVTSALAAALRPFAGAGAASTTGAAVLDFLSAGMFELTVDLEAGISNAGILPIVLTCLNHNL